MINKNLKCLNKLDYKRFGIHESRCVYIYTHITFYYIEISIKVKLLEINKINKKLVTDIILKLFTSYGDCERFSAKNCLRK